MCVSLIVQQEQNPLFRTRCPPPRRLCSKDNCTYVCVCVSLPAPCMPLPCQEAAGRGGGAVPAVTNSTCLLATHPV